MAKGIKTGGRKKGTPNRITNNIRQHVTELLTDNIDKLKTDFEVMESTDRVKYTIQLLKYVLPFATESETDTDDQIKEITVTIVNSKDEFDRLREIDNKN